MAQSLAQMNLTCAWLEAILLGKAVLWPPAPMKANQPVGINCMLFGGCIFVLQSTHAQAQRTLIYASVVQFTLAVAHAIVTFVETMEAFTTPYISAELNGVDNYYFALGGNSLNIASLSLYVVNTYTQELLLIWRLFIICNRKIEPCLLPYYGWLIVAIVGSMAVAQFMPVDATVFKRDVIAYSLAGWGLEMSVNAITSASIAYHIWRTGRRNASILGHFTHKLKAAFLMTIECGVLITICPCVMFILVALENPAGFIATSIGAQVAAITPLLIIVCVGLRATRNEISPPESAFSRPLDLNIAHSEDRSSDYPMHKLSPRGISATFDKGTSELVSTIGHV
ncbi:hypothetical protein BV22DRAFT_1125915 [Leucogyrophana mollusca]|uniref:Uncharacterized protein n=1 Tax=Leucogyrophana mollusca TaxID=85980 RepID=A0ACB8BT70_9AGAM|nr:hypothetical protein BV22DRAFT_1125915 [Leucogyrophana mollusca]